MINIMTNGYWGSSVLEDFMQEHDLIMYFKTHENTVTSTIGREGAVLVLSVLAPGSKIDTVVKGEGVTVLESYTKLIKHLTTGKGYLCLKSAWGSAWVSYPWRIE